MTFHVRRAGVAGCGPVHGRAGNLGLAADVVPCARCTHALRTDVACGMGGGHASEPMGVLWSSCAPGSCAALPGPAAATLRFLTPGLTAPRRHDPAWPRPRILTSGWEPRTLLPHATAPDPVGDRQHWALTEEEEEEGEGKEQASAGRKPRAVGSSRLRFTLCNGLAAVGPQASDLLTLGLSFPSEQ